MTLAYAPRAAPYQLEYGAAQHFSNGPSARRAGVLHAGCSAGMMRGQPQTTRRRDDQLSNKEDDLTLDQTRIEHLIQALRQIASGGVAEPALHARIALMNAGLEWKRPH